MPTSSSGGGGAGRRVSVGGGGCLAPLELDRLHSAAHGEAQTGAIGKIGIVLMAPQAPRYIAAKP